MDYFSFSNFGFVVVAQGSPEPVLTCWKARWVGAIAASSIDLMDRIPQRPRPLCLEAPNPPGSHHPLSGSPELPQRQIIL